MYIFLFVEKGLYKPSSSIIIEINAFQEEEKQQITKKYVIFFFRRPCILLWGSTLGGWVTVRTFYDMHKGN
jgi:hypothetical protein